MDALQDEWNIAHEEKPESQIQEMIERILRMTQILIDQDLMRK